MVLKSMKSIKSDSPYLRPVTKSINPYIRFVAIYVAPSVLLATAMVYVIGEFQNYKKTENAWLLSGAVLWTLGQLLTLIVLVTNSAGLGFHFPQAKSTNT